jgi:hypothetical protein
MPQHSLAYRNANSHHELKMDHEAESRTILLTSEIIKCIAKGLLASAEELERSLWHLTPSEQSRCASGCNDALSL